MCDKSYDLHQQLISKPAVEAKMLFKLVLLLGVVSHLHAQEVQVEKKDEKLDKIDPLIEVVTTTDTPPAQETDGDKLENKLTEFTNAVLGEIKSRLKIASEEKIQSRNKQEEDRIATLEIIDRKLNEFKSEILEEVKSGVKNASEERNQTNTHLRHLNEKIQTVYRCPLWKAKLGKDISLTKLETGHYFFSYQQFQTNWKDAKFLCESRGMELAEIRSEKEMKIVEGAAPQKQVEYWVGASDLGQNPGHFVWNDGRSVLKKRFNADYKQPDEFGAGKEACVYLWPSLGNLFDKPCSHNMYYFICKVGTDFADCP